jgi:hypothetical protein
VSSGTARERISILVKAVPLQSISITPGELSLVEGRSAKLEVVAVDVRGKRAAVSTLIWTTQHTSVATVANGTVVAHGPGTTVVFAQAGELKSSARLVVTAPVATKIVVVTSTSELRVNERAKFSATSPCVEMRFNGLLQMRMSCRSARMGLGLRGPPGM